MKTIKAPTIQSLANEMSLRFEIGKRTNGEEFRKLRDDSPDWMTDVCRAAHNGGEMLPDDWRYEFIEDAVDLLAECEDPGDAIERLEPNVYTHDLTAWLHSRGDRMGFVDDLLGDNAFRSGYELLAMAQFAEREEVLYQVKQALCETLENIEQA